MKYTLDSHIPNIPIRKRTRFVRRTTICDLCFAPAATTIFHPRIRLGRGRRPVGGIICPTCNDHLTQFPVCPAPLGAGTKGPTS